MPTEIEAKMRLEDPAGLALRLRNANAQPLGEVMEFNEFFDTAGDDLYRAGAGLRLRASRDLASGRARCAITHKGRRLPGEIKVREETEVGVDDAAAARQLLDRLGFRRRLAFEKRRQSWRLEKCRIEIDQVPHLGYFVEIEGPDEQSVLDMRRRLGLENSPLISESYARLVADYIESHGLETREVRFDRPDAEGRSAGPAHNM